MWVKWVLKKIGCIAFWSVVAFLIAIPVITIWRDKPTFAVTVRTWSMEPVFTRGDVVFLSQGNDKQLAIGDIIVFCIEKKDWVMHRIVGGTQEEGFITKGDANERTDQEGSGYPPVLPEWIAGVVPKVGSIPLKIPLLGHIPLIFEESLQNTKLLPVLLGILALVLLLDEVSKRSKKRKAEELQNGQLYFMGAWAFALLMGALMLMGSLFLTFPYGVEKDAGALLGSDVGIIKLGDSKEIDLAQLNNKGYVPSYYCVLCSDPQIGINQSRLLLKGGDSVKVNATVNALEEGMYRADLVIGMFMPFLPIAAID